MAGIRDRWEICYDFFGDALHPDFTTASNTATATAIDGSGSGAIRLAHTNADTAQDVTIGYNNQLAIDAANDEIYYEARVQVGQTMDTTSEAYWGLGSDLNIAPASVATRLLFNVDGSNAVVIQCDDATTDNVDVSTGVTMTANTWYRFAIDASNTSDVKFYIDGERVAGTTTFDFDQVATALQPLVSLSKAQDTNTDRVDVDYIYVTGARKNTAT